MGKASRHRPSLVAAKARKQKLAHEAKEAEEAKQGGSDGNQGQEEGQGQDPWRGRNGCTSTWVVEAGGGGD